MKSPSVLACGQCLHPAIFLRSVCLGLLMLAITACGGGGVPDELADTSKARGGPRMGMRADAAERVNQASVAGDQDRPSLTALADGGHVVAWRDEQAHRFQRFDASGARVGGEGTLRFSPGPALLAGGSATTALADGRFVIAYHDAREVPRPPAPPLIRIGVYFQMFDAAGGPVGAEQEVDSIVFRPNYRPPGYGGISALALADGSFVIGWEQIGVSSVTIRFGTRNRHYSAEGLALSPALTLGAPNSPGRSSYRLMADAMQGWTASVYQLDESYQSVATLLHFAAAEALRLSSAGEGDLLLALSDGRYVRFGAIGSGAHMEMLDAAGSALWRRPTASPAAAATELADGSFAVVWQAPEQFAVQVFAENGQPSTKAFDLPAAAGRPQLAPMGEGGFVLAWAAASESGDQDVYTQRFAPVSQRANAAQLQRWKACLDSVRGLRGQARKRQLDVCMQG